MERVRLHQDWRTSPAGAVAWFAAPSHRAGADLVGAVATLSASGGVTLPDIDLRARGVRIRLGAGAGPVSAPEALAREVSLAAAALGLVADPAGVQDLALEVDCADQAVVMPFWARVLGHHAAGDAGLLDPDRRLPPVRFRPLATPRPLRNRLHIDVVTPQEQAVAAVAGARSLGARRVVEHGYYATVSDPEGNEFDLLPLPEDQDRWPGPATADWRLVFSAMACYRTDYAAQAVQLARAVSTLADEAGLPLGIDLRPGLVTLDSGKDVWEMHPGYQELAAGTQQVARDLGATPEVRGPRFVQVGIDAVDIPAVRAFWCAVLGYVEDERPDVTDIVDPRRLGMPLFFQRLEQSDTARRAQRNRLHLQLAVPHDQAGHRIAAGLAAGGRVLETGVTPYRSILCDPEGNEVTIRTTGEG